ncbi:MAG: DNA polymerase III subunit delta [Desulfobacteraceae bacterium]|jgi:DNA polymerase-3 subunit delta
MAGDLPPEGLLKSMKEGQFAPLYLFYGPGEFRLEKVLDEIRTVLVPESVRDFNLEIFYGGETDPTGIINHARSLPFMARNRLIIVRRTENFAAEDLEKFLPYLEKPSESTCLIFVCSKPDFRKKFYSTIRTFGRAINFEELKESEVVPWIKRRATEMGLKMDGKACLYLQQIVGNRPRELYAEVEKLHLRYGNAVSTDEVKEMVMHSRMYTIFELIDLVSMKHCSQSLVVLNRFLEEEDRRLGPLRVIGMLNRQVRLLWQTKATLDRGGKTKDVAKKLGPVQFLARDLVKQSKCWSVEELERGLDLLYRADGWLKSGSRPKPVLENLIISLCS